MGCLKLTYQENGDGNFFQGLWKKSDGQKNCDNYYPFGLTFNSYSRENSVPNKYLYNDKELQTDLGLNWADYGARMYMSDIGRWGVIDPLVLHYYPLSAYCYVANNPIKFIDPDGKKIINPNNYVLSNKSFIKKLREFDAAVARITGLDQKSYSFEITGGDRYKKDGKIYSSTNDSEVKKSASNTRHLQDNGGVAVDLAHASGISSDDLEKAAKDVGLRIDPEGSYEDGHFHLDLGLDSDEAKEYAKDTKVDKSYKPTDADFEKSKEDKKEDDKGNVVKVTFKDGNKSSSTVVDTNNIGSWNDLMREVNRWLNWH